MSISLGVCPVKRIIYHTRVTDFIACELERTRIARELHKFASETEIVKEIV